MTSPGASGEDEVAAIDKRDGVAELFDLIHAVGGEEDCSTLIAEVDERVLQERGVDGVKAAKRLVHDDEVGFVKKRGDELDLLLHPLGELLPVFFSIASVISMRSHQRGSLAGGGSVEAVKLRQER